MGKKFFLMILFFILGIFFLINSKVDITGAVIGSSSTLLNFNFTLGIIFIIISALLFIEGDLENKIRIYSKKELSHLTPKKRAFRKKLVNLYDLQKPIDPKKIAYLLPEYDKVQDTGEFIQSHSYKVYKGRKGSIEEYFTVDTREMIEVELGDHKILLPTHIDIQERIDKNRYSKIRKENINWDKMIKESSAEDILGGYFKKKKLLQKD